MSDYDLPVPQNLLQTVLNETMGPAARLNGWQSLGGGTRKTVHRQEIPQSPLVLLNWGNRPDYFGEQALNDPRQEVHRYAANTQYLLANGVRVPRLFFFASGESKASCAFALVEYIRYCGLILLMLKKSPRSALILSAVFAAVVFIVLFILQPIDLSVPGTFEGTAFIGLVLYSVTTAMLYSIIVRAETKYYGLPGLFGWMLTGLLLALAISAIQRIYPTYFGLIGVAVIGFIVLRWLSFEVVWRLQKAYTNHRRHTGGQG
jgi:hypothetical protein